MRQITLTSVECPALQYFPTLSHKWQDFRKIINELKMWVLIFSTALVRNISNFKKRTGRDFFINEHSCSCLCSCRILMKLELYQKIFQKLLKYQI